MDPRIDRLRGLLAIGVLLGHASDLTQFAVPNPERLPAVWRPGLGGVLIHDDAALYLAAI